MGVRNLKKILDFIKDHGILSGLIGSILTIVAGIFTVPVILSTNYVSVNSIDILVDNYFVKTGLVAEDILELELDEQFQTLANYYSDDKLELAGYEQKLEDILVDSGETAVAIRNMSSEDMLSLIQEKIVNTKSQNDTITSLNHRIDELEAQTTAEIIAATLVVDGEQIDTNIPNSMAIIDGHYFYAESLLNSFLEDDLSADISASTIYYGSQRAEKVVFQADMITNTSGFTTYAVGNGTSFKMGTDTYDNGFVTNNGTRSYFYANLKGAYSKLSFVVGHIDGTPLDNATIYIYTKNGNEQHRLVKSYDLSPEMFPEEKQVEINYADGVQIVIEGSYYAKYAIADVYLYR